MSLQVDEHRRGRSRSPGRRERSPARVVDAAPAEDDYTRPKRSSAYDDPAYTSSSAYRYETASPRDNDYYRSGGAGGSSKLDALGYLPHKYEDKPKKADRDSLNFLPQKYSRNLGEDDAHGSSREKDQARAPSRDRDRTRERSRERRSGKYDDDLAYGSGHVPVREGHDRPRSPYGKIAPPGAAAPPGAFSYEQPKQWEYAKVEDSVQAKYGARESASVPYGTIPDSLVPDAGRHRGRSPSPGPSRTESKKYSSRYEEAHGSGANVLTVEPKQPGHRDRSPGPSAMRRERSPAPPIARMSSLTVNTGLAAAAAAGAAGGLSVANAPASPLLESYHGTYQSMSPMPSPMLLAADGGIDMYGLEVPPSPGALSDDGSGRKKRRARFHDPVDDAARLAKALKGERRAPETEPLIEILPGLTHEQVMELRTEYKRLVKTGANRKGVNVAKHIRARLKDEDPMLMKACYSVALGQWESEAYWANFWYHGDKTRRELLIESLMGRTNDEVRRIKDSFSDKKYNDDLRRCMEMELKEDKFKKAIMYVLDEKRMEEVDGYGRPRPINTQLVLDDIEDLHQAVSSEKGGESRMLSIIVKSSDRHLREVMKEYTRKYRSNFPNVALRKSGNLVGEVLAHILNGVINKPFRDAMLLNHAITASKKDDLRRELLISRLVRFHWDSQHMDAIRVAYHERYGKDLQEAVKEATSGEWGMFCEELCVRRMPDSVKKFERVEIIDR